MFKSLKNIYVCLPKIRRRQIIITALLVGIAAGFEVIGLASVIPFLSMMTEPVDTLNKLSQAVNGLGIQSSILKSIENTNNAQLIRVYATVIFCILISFSGLLRLVLLRFQIKTGFLIGYDVAKNLYESNFNREYLEFLKVNNNETIANIVIKVEQLINQVIIPFFVVTGSFFILTAISVLLIIKMPGETFIAISIIALTYIVITNIASSRINRSAITVNQNADQITKIVTESFQGFKEVKLHGSEEKYLRNFSELSQEYRNAQARISVIAGVPRFIIETLSILCIAILTFVLFLQDEDISSVVPALGLLAIGAQKLLPLFQQIYYSYTALKGSKEILASISNEITFDSDLLINKQQNKIKIHEFNSLRIDNISFGYKPGHNVISSLNLFVKKGQIIGIKGKSGEGKSTLLGIISGLITPVAGKILMNETIDITNDSIARRSLVSMVPQEIFIKNDALSKNIAFAENDLDSIDGLRLEDAAKKAEIDSFVEGLEAKYKTVIGQDGFQLSGGQMQRIGIARSLYADKEILIFDESTSGLDLETEQKILKTIANLRNRFLIIIVSHRRETFKYCDEIFEIQRGELKKINL